MLHSNFKLYSHWLSCFFLFFYFRFLKFNKESIFLSAIVCRVYSQIQLIYIHTIYTYIYYMHSSLTAPITKSSSRSRSQANDKWHDVICAKSLIDTHESCCGSSSGEVPFPTPPSTVQPSPPPQTFYIEGDSICKLIPCKASAGWGKETYSIKQGRVFRGYLLVVQWGVGTAMFVPQFASFLLLLRLRRSQKWPNALMKLILITMTMTMTMWGRRRQWGLLNRSRGRWWGGVCICVQVCVK